MSRRVCLTADVPSAEVERMRAAVWGWLLARHHDGTFLLRGQNRVHVEAMCAELRRLGLDWDEVSVPDAGRPACYQRLARQLVEQGCAYERDGAIWFRICRSGQIDINDLILRTLAFEQTDLGDPLLIASDGSPSPLWAEVADLHLLQVTHVVRLAAQLSDLPLHIQIHRALGRMPAYLHLPSIGGAEGVRLADLLAEGYSPLALVNALATLGWTPRGKRRLREMDELIAGFDLAQVSRQATWSWEALDRFNHSYLNQLDLAALTELLVPRWHAAFGLAHRADETTLSPNDWQALLTRAIRSELDVLSQAVKLARPFFDDQLDLRPDAVETLAQPYAPDVLRAFVDGLSTLEPFAYDPLNEFVSALRYRFKASHGIRSRDAMFVIRAALTGRTDGPCLIEACLLLGRARCLQRARYALMSGPGAGRQR